MPAGDADDILARLKSVLPAWFGAGATPVLDAVLSGFAAVAAHAFAMLAYVRDQTRISTATDGFLDLTAADFFGRNFQRRDGESDESYRLRIIAEIFRERGTKTAMIKALEGLTGIAPYIFEPWNIASTGGWGEPTIGYGVAGGWSSDQYPATAFIYAFRPATVSRGTPNINGWGGVLGGWGAGAVMYDETTGTDGAITDEDILATVNAVKPVGVRTITTIS